MKMLLIVFRQSMVDHIHALLREYDVTAFTELHNVAGRGETGPNVQFLLSPGSNCMILTAISEQLAYRYHTPSFGQDHATNRETGLSCYPVKSHD